MCHVAAAIHVSSKHVACSVHCSVNSPEWNSPATVKPIISAYRLDTSPLPRILVQRPTEDSPWRWASGNVEDRWDTMDDYAGPTSTHPAKYD